MGTRVSYSEDKGDIEKALMEMMESLYEGVLDKKRKIKTSDYRMGGVYNDIAALLTEIDKDMLSIEVLETVLNNAKIAALKP